MQANPHLRAPPDARATACSARGARRGLAASLSARAAPPGAACDTAPAPPPPPAAAAAACTTQPPPSRRPSAAPRPPGFTGSGDRGAKPWGREGRNAPPSASGAGEPRNRRRHRRACGGAGGARKRPPQRPWSPASWPGPASRGHFYLRAMASASQTPSRVLPDERNPPPGFPAALASGRPLECRLPATSDFSWRPSRGWGL